MSRSELPDRFPALATRAPSAVAERRRTPRGRRTRDRLFQSEAARSLAARKDSALENLLLLVEDDLRESVLALQAIESWLCRADKALDREPPRRADLYPLAEDREIVQRLDVLVETLLSLRTRLGNVGDAL